MLTQDPKQQFEDLKTKVLEQIKQTFPIPDKLGKMEVRVHDLRVDDALGTEDIKGQFDARMNSRSWGAPVFGSLEVVDTATGKVLTRRSNVRIANIPKLTRHYSYIVGGQEKQVANQWRLKPGAYVKATERANEFEAQFQLAKGGSFDLRLDPASGYLYMDVGRKVPLYTVLNAAGVSDAEMEKAWGTPAFKATLSKSKGDADIASLYRASFHRDPPTGATPQQLVQEYFNSTQMSPDVTTHTLGKPFEQVNAEALMRAATKLQRVSAKTEKPDPIDSLQFKELWTAGDQFVERLARSKADIHNRIQKALGRPKIRAAVEAGKSDSLRDVVAPDVFQGPFAHVFATSLASNAAQVNPASMLAGRSLVTLVGPGGIQNPNAITESNTAIDPSHLGFVDPVHTPEAEAGKNLHLTVGADIRNRKPTVQMWNIKTKQLEAVTPAVVSTKVVALPDQVRWSGGRPTPIGKVVRVNDAKGEIRDVPFEDVDYILPSATQMFSAGSNLVPFMQNDSAHRSTMSARHMEQAISIEGREPPRVQVEAGNGITFEELIGGGFLSIRSPAAGTVKAVTKDHIVVEAADGKSHTVHIYNYYPLNDPKAMLHSFPLVKPGDKVKQGQNLADNNFTKNGVLALGTNLRVAYIANGANHEDGIVISETAAKKLASVHLNKPELYVTKDHVIDKKKFVTNKGDVYTQKQYGKIGDDGVIRVGQMVEPGDPLVLALNASKNPDSINVKALARLSRKAKTPYSNDALTWDHDHPGEVVRVHSTAQGITVHVRTLEPAVVGSKLSTRHSAKGIVAAILPDAEMPYDAQHKPVEMLINPLGVGGRMNPGQILETVAGKVAEKTGKTYIVKNFEAGVDYLEKVRGDLKKAGLSESDVLYDPKTKRKLGDITVGPHYVFQLVHQIDKKSSVRAGGAAIRQTGMAKIYYDGNGIPRGGGESGAQSLGSLGIYAALASGLRDNLREMQTLKSDREQAENVWAALNKGDLLPTPQVPFAFKKFENLLKAAGINVEKSGSTYRLMPLTDTEVLALSRGEIKKPNLAVVAKNMAPDKQGIFDPHILGGRDGNHWGHIALFEPMPNPVFEKSIALILGEKQEDIQKVIEEEHSLGKHGTGTAALVKALKAVDVEHELKATRKQLDDPHLRDTPLNNAYQKYKALQLLHRMGKRADEAYILHNLPVLPPIFRPVIERPDGSLLIDDLNQLYRRLGMVNVELKNEAKGGVPRDPKQVAALYVEMKNLFGTTPKGKKALELNYQGSQEKKNRPLSGVLHTLSGEIPKDSFFQKRLIAKKQDFTAHITIVADPTLSVDEVAVPKKIAFELFRPMVAHRLTQYGKTPIEAHTEISKHTELAERMLEKEIAERPVLLKRNPVLHQYGIVGQRVVLTNSPAVKVSPLILPPVGGDIDGDTVALMVPITREAVAEVHKIMPSQRPIAAASGDVLFTPTNEAALALYRASLPRHDSKKKFVNLAEAEAAFKADKLNLDEVSTIGADRTTLGRARMAVIVPEAYKKQVLTDLKNPFTKNLMHEILKHTAKTEPKHFEAVATGLSRLGFQMAYESGHSITLKDLDPLRAEREKVVSAAKALVDKTTDPAKQTEIWVDATRKLHDIYTRHFDKNPSNISDMLKSKIKLKSEQYQGLVIAPMLVLDHMGQPSKVPVTKSFSEGLDLGGYWLQSSGARRGVIQKTESTQEPGYMTKLLVQTGIDQNITGKDCGTNQGLLMRLDNKDVIDRYLASPVVAGGKSYASGTIITPDIQRTLVQAKVEKIPVRSPLKCRMPQGVCSVCMGVHPDGHHYTEGDAVGIVAAQALGERATQLMLKQTHGGGIMPLDQKGVIEQFKMIQNLFYMQEPNSSYAVVAPRAGKIKSVTPQAHGGYNVVMDGSSRALYSVHKPVVKAGDDVVRGQKLTGGDINVHDLLNTQGIDAVQDHMVHQIGKIYAGEGVLQRHVELAVRNSTGLVRVVDPGDHPHFVKGDFLMKPMVDSINREMLKDKHPIKVAPILKSVMILPKYSQQDWMARLQTTRLQEHLLTAAQQGQTSDIHGANPIPGLAQGSEFGRTSDKSKY